MPRDQMLLWVCIPVFNRLEFTRACLECLRRQEYQNFRVVICDDASSDGTSEVLREYYPEVIVLQGSGELWWTGGINRCIEYVLQNCGDDDVVVTLNNDVEIAPDYLSSLLKVAGSHPGSLVGSACYDIKSGALQSAGVRHSWWTASRRPVDLTLGDDLQGVEVDRLAGRGTLIPVQVLRQIGLFDFEHLPHYGADFDLSYRARRHGHRLFVALAAHVLVHVDEARESSGRQGRFFPDFVENFASRRSPNNLQARFWVAYNNCPKPLLASYLLLDLARLGGNFLRRWRQGRARAGNQSL